MKKASAVLVLAGLAIAAWSGPIATADEVAQPWGTVHGNIYGTQASNAPAMKFSPNWAKGAVPAWVLDVRAAGSDRVAGGQAISFDEDGNIYWKTSIGGGTGGQTRVCSASPAGVMRWGHTPGSVTLGPQYDRVTPVVGDGGQAGRVYCIGTNAAGDSIVVAQKKSDGTLAWAAPTVLPGANFGGTYEKLTPVLYGGKLFIAGVVAGGSREIYQVDSATGNLDWQATVSGFECDAGGQMTLVPDIFGPGKHGLYMNCSTGSGTDGRPEMYAVLVDTTAGTASLAWSSEGGHDGNSHVVYMRDVNRVFTLTWRDFGNNCYGWNPDGSYPTQTNTFTSTGFGYTDLAAVDFNGTDLIGGGFSGQAWRFGGINPGSPPSPPVVIYDSGGFEAFALGNLNGQDGWIGSAEGTGTAPQVVDASSGDPVLGSKAVRLEVTTTQGDKSHAEKAIADAVAAGYGMIYVSFDVYRASADTPLENLWWWANGNNPIYGIQWDQGPSTLPNGWNAGAGSVPTITDRWVNVTLQYNVAEGKASSWYDGVPVDNSITLTGINEFLGWTFELAHDAGTGTGGEVAWIDNLVISGSTSAGGSGAPTLAGYYNLGNYGELRYFGGLYQDLEGNSIVVSGSSSYAQPTIKVFAADVTNGTLIQSCADWDDAPLLIDNLTITEGPATGTENVVLDTGGWEGLTIGNLAGQTSPGLDGAGWQDDNYGNGGGGTPVQVIADPTGAGRGNVVSIDALQSCGGTKGFQGILASSTPGNDIVIVSWDQYRGDLTDNVWYDDRVGGGWYAYQWDQTGQVSARRDPNASNSVVATAGVWQHVEYKFDYINYTVTVTVDGNSASDLLDPFAEFYLNGWAMRVEATEKSNSIPRTMPIFEYDAGAISEARGGPQLGPNPTCGKQQIYYFNTSDGKLVALKPAGYQSDYDNDGDVDVNDFATFQACFNGPSNPYAAPGCGKADADCDGDVDVNDFAAFQSCFNGPSNPPPAGC